MPCEIATPYMQPEWPVEAEAGCAACCLRKENARARARHKILEAQVAKRYIYMYTCTSNNPFSIRLSAMLPTTIIKKIMTNDDDDDETDEL